MANTVVTKKLLTLKIIALESREIKQATTMMTSSYPSPLLGRFASPPFVIANPDLIKYLILQLFAEATFVVTLAVLGGMALREEWRHVARRWKRRMSGREVGGAWRRGAAGGCWGGRGGGRSRRGGGGR